MTNNRAFTLALIISASIALTVTLAASWVSSTQPAPSSQGWTWDDSRAALVQYA